MTLEGLSQKKGCTISITDRFINRNNEWQNISSTCIRSCIDNIPSEKKILRTLKKRTLYSTNKEIGVPRN